MPRCPCGKTTCPPWHSSLLKINEGNVKRLEASKDSELSTLLMSLRPSSQKFKGNSVRCPRSHALCWKVCAGMQHGKRLREMTLPQLEAALECYIKQGYGKLENWRQQENAYWTRAASDPHRSRVLFRRKLLAPIVLREQEFDQHRNELDEIIEESALKGIMPVLRGTLEEEQRGVLARVYGLQGYDETMGRKASAMLSLAVKIAQRWEPPLKPTAPRKWQQEFCGPASLFTSDAIFPADWKQWKARIVASMTVPRRADANATRARLACTVGAQLAVLVNGTLASFAKVKSVSKLAHGPRKTLLGGELVISVVLATGAESEATIVWPSPALVLAHEAYPPRWHARQATPAVAPLPTCVTDHIFRHLDRLALPASSTDELENRFAISHFTSISHVLDYMIKSPLDNLTFPGQLVQPSLAGRVWAEHKQTHAALVDILTQKRKYKGLSC